MCIPINSIANEQTEESLALTYWACMPVFVEIDYSYLQAGDWIGKEFGEKIKFNIARINNYPNDVERGWGLVNCIVQ